MKYIIKILLLGGLLLGGYKCNHTSKSDLKLQTIFNQDSGFINKEQLLFIVPNVDTTFFEYYESDTMGKYFKDKKNNSYTALICSPDSDQYTTTKLISVDISTNEIRQGVGFLCWWYNPELQISEFTLKDRYYYIPTCIGHGTAFSAMGFYLFSDIDSVNNTIYGDIFSGNPIPYFYYLSLDDFYINNDSLIVNYTLEEGIWEEINDVDSSRVISSEKWQLQYFLKDSEWHAVDSTLFETDNTLFM